MFSIFKTYIRRSSIDSIIDRARKDERDTTEAKWKRLMADQREALENEKDLAVREEQAKIRSLELEIEEMYQKVKRADEIYFRAVRRTKENVQISIDMGVIAESMINESARIYTKLKEVGKRAKHHADSLKNEAMAELEKAQVDPVRDSLISELKEGIQPPRLEFNLLAED